MKKRKYEKRILAVIIWFTILMQTDFTRFGERSAQDG